MSRSRLQFVLSAALLALPALAQQEEKADESARGHNKGAVGIGGEESDEKAAAREKAGLSGFKPEETARTLSARDKCRFDCTVRPDRLLPGQTGKLFITMILQGDAVMEAPAPLTLEALTDGLSAGQFSIRPASRASVAEAYKGELVYDNWAVIELPVTMPREAKIGEKRHVVLGVDFDLHSAKDGSLLGSFHERVTGECEVGMSQQPVVAGAATAAPAPHGGTAEASDGAAPATGDAPGAPEARPVATGASGPDGVAQSVSRPADRAAPEEPSDASRPPVEDAGSNLAYVVGGGVLLLLAVAFLFKRR